MSFHHLLATPAASLPPASANAKSTHIHWGVTATTVLHPRHGHSPLCALALPFLSLKPNISCFSGLSHSHPSLPVQCRGASFTLVLSYLIATFNCLLLSEKYFDVLTISGGSGPLQLADQTCLLMLSLLFPSLYLGNKFRGVSICLLPWGCTALAVLLLQCY